jgi:hypothetical protein
LRSTLTISEPQVNHITLLKCVIEEGIQNKLRPEKTAYLGVNIILAPSFKVQ